ncbi:MAG TPA: hypothetical protein VGM88_20890 [Kofleriaceae bacterium]|jgi:triacylglycerol lipase
MWLAVAALLVVLLALAVIAARRPRPPVAEIESPLPEPRAAPVTPAADRVPIVLVHGLFGFDRIGVPGARFNYFRGIAEHLRSLGVVAHAVRLPRAAAVPDRAAALVAAIDRLGAPRVDLIAHSLGGLDARFAIARLGLAPRVRTLVTIGTPHRGTPLAELAPIPRKLLRTLGLPLSAIDWLTPAALARFNADVPDVPSVRYACVVGAMHRTGSAEDAGVPLALIPAHAYLLRLAGPNDGLVPLASQYWGETLAEIDADHFAQIGWRLSLRGTFDALGLYAFIASRLGNPEHASATG